MRVPCETTHVNLFGFLVRLATFTFAAAFLGFFVCERALLVIHNTAAPLSEWETDEQER